MYVVLKGRKEYIAVRKHSKERYYPLLIHSEELKKRQQLNKAYKIQKNTIFNFIWDFKFHLTRFNPLSNIYTYWKTTIWNPPPERKLNFLFTSQKWEYKFAVFFGLVFGYLGNPFIKTHKCNPIQNQPFKFGKFSNWKINQRVQLLWMHRIV